jgi:hypothetical protein
MSTLLSYLAAVGRPEGPARLVWAGHEPREFINLFPEWTELEEVKIFNAKVSECQHGTSSSGSNLCRRCLKDSHRFGPK